MLSLVKKESSSSGRPRRIKASNSPLGRPERPIHVLAGKLQEYLFFPSPDPLYVVLGTVAGNMLKGNPIWAVLVGPPASGKTLLLDMLYINQHVHLPRTISVDMVKSPGALLSAVASKDIKKGSTGGLLRQLGDNGMLVIKDFTSMMSLPREPLIETIGAFRRIYDGSWDRSTGTDGGRVLYWSGKIGLLSASTGVIDKHHQILAELGERWIYYRYDDSDGYGESRAVLKNRNPKDAMMVMHELVSEFLEQMGIRWEVDVRTREEKEDRERLGLGFEFMDRRELTDLESNRIFNIAAFVAAARSGVDRDWKSREVVSMRETEKPTRLSSALGQLYLGLELIGLEETERWRIIGRVGLDSIPRIRGVLIRKAINGVIRSNDLVVEMGSGITALRWGCEDLHIHKIFDKVEKGDRFGDRAGSWRLSEWGKKLIKLGWSGESE